jgi:hypothetical protein
VALAEAVVEILVLRVRRGSEGGVGAPVAVEDAVPTVIARPLLASAPHWLCCSVIRNP